MTAADRFGPSLTAIAAAYLDLTLEVHRMAEERSKVVRWERFDAKLDVLRSAVSDLAVLSVVACHDDEDELEVADG